MARRIEKKVATIGANIVATIVSNIVAMTTSIIAAITVAITEVNLVAVIVIGEFCQIYKYIVSGPPPCYYYHY